MRFLRVCLKGSQKDKRRAILRLRIPTLPSPQVPWFPGREVHAVAPRQLSEADLKPEPCQEKHVPFDSKKRKLPVLWPETTLPGCFNNTVDGRNRFRTTVQKPWFLMIPQRKYQPTIVSHGFHVCRIASTHSMSFAGEPPKKTMSISILRCFASKNTTKLGRVVESAAQAMSIFTQNSVVLVVRSHMLNGVASKLWHRIEIQVLANSHFLLARSDSDKQSRPTKSDKLSKRNLKEE